MCWYRNKKYQSLFAIRSSSVGGYRGCFEFCKSPSYAKEEKEWKEFLKEKGICAT